MGKIGFRIRSSVSSQVPVYVYVYLTITLNKIGYYHPWD